MCTFGSAYFGESMHICKKENITVICDYIPNSIPNGTERVYLKLELLKDVALNNGTFTSSGWKYVKVLELQVSTNSVRSDAIHFTLQDHCFQGLDELEELRVHVECTLDLFADAFAGIYNARILDLSWSVRFYLSELTPALNGSNKFPKLTQLILSNCALYRSESRIDDKMVEVLLSKKLSDIDISHMQLAEVNFTAFKLLTHLRLINISFSAVGGFDIMYLIQNDIKKIKVFDISYATLPKKTINVPPGKLKISNVHLKSSEFPDNFKLFLTAKTMNISGLTPQLTSIWISSSELQLDQNPSFLSKELIFRQNNIKRLDVKLNCDHFQFSSFEHLDISENGLEFLHPEFLPCFPNVKDINFSTNLLVKMMHENITMFEQLFSHSRSLKEINLSRNELYTIPMRTFERNKELDVLDLSYNRLDQVHIVLSDLKMLKILNLKGNLIRTLDKISVDNLNSILGEGAIDKPKVTVILKANPLSCDKCESKHFLSWLISTNLVNVPKQELTCINEKGMSEAITENTLRDVERICKRHTIINATIVSAGCIAVILGIILQVWYVQRRHQRTAQNRANVINLLRAGEGKYEFAVFLAFSNDDVDFVNRYVLNYLNENLQLMTGIDRELVCTGDRHFRPGFYVHNEACRSLDTASVVVVVASEKFCQSSYCRSELDQAYVKKKPIVLMLVEHIDQEVMTPTIKELYQTKVRILWTQENDGDYKMKTSWENVCTSILDLIQE